MSYPSINESLKERNISLETASDKELEAAFIDAFKSDLPLGFNRVKELVAKFRAGDGARANLVLDPKSDEGKQFARLLGPDIPRKVLESYFEVSFGFYNCCNGLVANSKSDLKMTMQEQIAAQHPQFVDC